MAYISRCRGLRDRLLRCGGAISEEAFVTVIIAGLGPHWHSTRALLRAHGKISEAALCAEIHAEQQDMDLYEERHKKKASAPEFEFHTQRRYNNNNNRQNNRQVQQYVPPFCHLCETSRHPHTHTHTARINRSQLHRNVNFDPQAINSMRGLLAANHWSPTRRMQPSPRASRPGRTLGSWTVAVDSTCAPQGLEADSTTQEFKLFHGIGKAVLKNNVFVLDFVPDQVGLHLGIEKHYNAWKIFYVHSKETVAAHDVIFYERLTLQTYLDNLTANRDLTGSFSGKAFTSAADEANWDEQNVDGASEEAGPLPYCSVNIPMDDDNPRESVNAETYFDFADTGYVTPQPVDTNISERIGPNFLSDLEVGDEAAYPEDTNLPRYTQSGLQILGLVTSVHGAAPPKEPANIQQALGGEHKEKWREAMDRELKALQERNTWKVVLIRVAHNKTILTGKWVFRVKTKADGTINKFKARWVVRGFDQEQGRDFTETFAPMSRHTSLRILLAIAAMNLKKLRQIDVANAFLYTPVDAEIFDELPHGSNADPNHDCQLEKSLYGIKQAPRLWQQHFHARVIRIGFLQLPHDQGMYRLTKGIDYIILTFYVDDLLYIGSTDDITTWFEGELQQNLTLTVAITVTQYLGLNIQDDDNAIYLSVEKYTDTISKRFGLTPTVISTPYRYTDGNRKASTLLKPAGIRDYQRKLGCLLFAAVTCRPDLSYSASQLATYLKKPEAEYMLELNRALHYLVSTPTIGLTYHKTGTTTPK
ncbi:unnamed protein product [Closterium sp. NIES-53]